MSQRQGEEDSNSQHRPNLPIPQHLLSGELAREIQHCVWKGHHSGRLYSQVILPPRPEPLLLDDDDVDQEEPQRRVNLKRGLTPVRKVTRNDVGEYRVCPSAEHFQELALVSQDCVACLAQALQPLFLPREVRVVLRHQKQRLPPHEVQPERNPPFGGEK